MMGRSTVAPLRLWGRSESWLRKPELFEARARSKTKNHSPCLKSSRLSHPHPFLLLEEQHTHGGKRAKRSSRLSLVHHTTAFLRGSRDSWISGNRIQVARRALFPLFPSSSLPRFDYGRGPFAHYSMARHSSDAACRRNKMLRNQTTYRTRPPCLMSAFFYLSVSLYPSAAARRLGTS